MPRKVESAEVRNAVRCAMLRDIREYGAEAVAGFILLNADAKGKLEALARNFFVVVAGEGEPFLSLTPRQQYLRIVEALQIFYDAYTVGAFAPKRKRKATRKVNRVRRRK